MYKIREHNEEIITNILSNIIWYVLSVICANILMWIPLIRGVCVTIKNSSYAIPLYAFVLAGVSVLVMIIISTISVIFLIKNFKSKEEDIATDLILNSLDIELYFKNREVIFTYLTYDGVVNADNYEQFSKSILWTGYKYNYTKIIESNGSYELVDSNRKASPYYYSVKFNKKLFIGDNVYFKLETSVSDDDKSMNPVFSHMVKQQTYQFTIRLTVPRDLIKNVRPTVYRDLTRTIIVPNNIRLKEEYVGDLIQYSYTIENPKMMNNYCIEWEFK